MPLVFTRDEIREYLAEMGYGNLNEEDLNQFVKDLRKLIKMESRKRRRRRLGHTGHTHSDLSSTADEEENSMNDSENIDLKTFTPIDVKTFTPIDVKTFTPIDVKTFTPIDVKTFTPIDVKTFTPIDLKAFTPIDVKTFTPIDLKTVTPIPKPNENQFTSLKSSRISQNLLYTPKTSQKPFSETSTSDSTSYWITTTTTTTSGQYSVDTSADNDVRNHKKELKLPPKAIRRDPVALYHWYKTFWDRQKAPGEDRHMQLRWNVRAGTVGKYPCDADGIRINYLPLNPVKQKKKICV